jgi:hypothetical protein
MPSYPPYFTGPTRRMRDVPTPARAKPAMLFWSIVMILAVLGVLGYMLVQMVPGIAHFR